MKPLLIIIQVFIWIHVSFAETEPNDHCHSANPLALGDFINGNFGFAGDMDYFVFQINQTGVYRFEVSSTDISKEIEYSIIHNNNCVSHFGGNLKAKGSNSGIVFLNLCDTGTYYLRLAERNLILNLAEYSLKIEIDPVDLYECNNSLDQATGITIDSLYTSYLFGVINDTLYFRTSDIDYYKLTIPSKGILKVNFPLVPKDTDFVIRVRLLDSLNRVIAYDCICGNTSVLEYLQALICDAGTYYISIDARNGRPSQYPYSFYTNFLSDSTECNDELKAAFHIENEQIVSGYSGGFNAATGIKDIDWYSFDIAQAGVFDLSIQRSDSFFVYEIVLFNQDGNEILNTHYYFQGLFEFKDYALCDPGRYYLKLIDNSTGPCGTSKSKFNNYTLKLQNVFPDIYECNDDFNSATDVIDMDTIWASFANFGDTDIYKIFLHQYDTLFVYLEPLNDFTSIHTNIYNNSKIRLFSGSFWEPDTIKFINRQKANYIYIQLADVVLDSIKYYKLILENHLFLTNSNDIPIADQIKLIKFDPDLLILESKLLEELSNITYCIVNSMGQMVRSTNSLPKNRTIDIKEIPEGLYHLVLFDLWKKPISLKFIKSKIH